MKRPAATDTVMNRPPAALYRRFDVAGAASLAKLEHELGQKRMLLVYKINRRDLKHIKENDILAIPENGDSELIYAPFPLTLTQLDSTGKLIVINRRVQAFGIYEHGKLIRWGPTSTGKKATPTPPGLYHTNWKSKETHSTVDESWVMKWYFNLDNLEGISMHQYDLPGYPASHSCVRLLEEDAFWIYNWADQWKFSPGRDSILAQGTPVIVFGDYAYGATPPWKKLLTNERATTISEAELVSAIDRYLPRTSDQFSHR